MREPTIERTAVLGACELPWQSEVISSALEGILTVAEDGRLLSMNRAAERLLGVRWADVAGKPIETFIPKRYHAMHRDFVALFLASGLRAREMTARNPVDVRRADGTEFVAEVSLVRISISGKPAAGCIIRDISERRRANQQLRLQAQLLEQSRAAAVAFDSHGKVTYWNGAAEQLYGCSREEALGKTVRELGVVEVPPEVQVAIREAINNDQEWEGDLRAIRHKDGVRIVRVAMAPVYDEANKLIGAVSHALNVTEERQAEALLHAQSALLEEIAAHGGLDGGLDALSELIEQHFTGIRCTLHLVEPGGERLRFAAGYRMRPLDVGVEETPGARAALRGEPITVEDFRLDPRYEAIRPRVLESGLLASASLPVFVQGQIRGAVTLTFERPGLPGEREQRLLETAAKLMRVALEQDLAHSARVEAQKFEGVGSLAAGVAHDFNNILTSIVGNAAIARLSVPEGVASDALRDIELAGQRAGELAHQLLAYSGRSQRINEPQDLNSLVREMTQLLRVSLKPGVQLVYRLSGKVPPVFGDATQLRQVIMNLVLNASDAIGSRQGEVRVATGRMEADERYLRRCHLGDLREPGPYAYIEIRDTGPGMDAKTLARLFEPYFSTKFAGRGLGLAAVFGIVRSHGGAILVRSRIGQGSTFRVLLPLTPCDDAAAASEGTSGERRHRPGRSTPPLVHWLAVGT